MNHARLLVLSYGIVATTSGSRPLAVPPETSITVPGLRQPVEVRRDRWGVPHIYAGSQHDLFLAQGFVAAEDRLFQMEMWRRQGEGRLAEVLGPAAIERDRLARAFRYRGDMSAEWTSYGPDTRQIVTAFVQGVNAYIAGALRENALAPEFALLGFKPEPWTIDVPLARVTILSGIGNATSEVLRAQLVAKLGERRVEQLLPTNPRRALDPAPGIDLTGIDARVLGSAGSAFADVAYNRIEGSNNWVVSGSRTVSGKPILANDPHRVITNPAVRYITHLVAPGWNVIGAGEPASPGVAIGHNDLIGFGLTIVGMDQQDVYVETLGACPGAASGDRFGCYRHRNAWRPVTVVAETLQVKGERARAVRLLFTSHGPVVSIDSARSRGFALRGVYSEPGTASYLASLSLDRARNWKEFSAAMSRWRMPSENMIYADVDGNIGWIAGGLMPRRTWSGLLPVPGDGSSEWSGFVPGRDLPRALNPAAGFIATANHNILPPGYPIPLSYEWSSRYRIDRIMEVLRQDRKFTVDDFKRLQHDDYSKLAEALVPRLVESARRSGQGEREDVRLLAGWNLRMSRDQLAPTLFEAWSPRAYQRVMTLVLADQPDVAAVLARRTEYEWLESYLADPSDGGGPGVSRDDVDRALMAALDDAVADLSRRFGADRAKWRWGDVHLAYFAHPIARRFDLAPVSRGGNATTVYATGGASFRQTSGASYREIIDFADFDNSWATNVPGQSGNPSSPHYADLLPLWGSDQYFPLVYSRKRVEQETERVTRMIPRKQG